MFVWVSRFALQNCKHSAMPKLTRTVHETIETRHKVLAHHTVVQCHVKPHNTKWSSLECFHLYISSMWLHMYVYKTMVYLTIWRFQFSHWLKWEAWPNIQICNSQASEARVCIYVCNIQNNLRGIDNITKNSYVVHWCSYISNQKHPRCKKGAAKN